MMKLMMADQRGWSLERTSGAVPALGKPGDERLLAVAPRTVPDDVSVALLSLVRVPLLRLPPLPPDEPPITEPANSLSLVATKVLPFAPLSDDRVPVTSDAMAEVARENISIMASSAMELVNSVLVIAFIVCELRV